MKDELILCNQTLVFDWNQINFIKNIRNEFYKLSTIYGEEFESRYREFGSLKRAFENTRSLGYEYIARTIDAAIKKCIDVYEIYDVNRETFVKYDQNRVDFITEWSNIMTNFENLYIDLESQYLSETERRAFRKEARGRIVGGGFGLSGAAKGIATAGAINLATGAAHSVFNSIGNAISKLNMDSEAEKIYNDSYILKVLSNKIREIINHIGTILWFSVIKLSHNDYGDMRQSQQTYKNLVDGLISIDKIPDVLLKLIYDLWPFESGIFEGTYIDSLSDSQKN